VRAFVAVEVPSSAEERARDRAPEHLTLLFLGEISVERVGPIEAALAPVAAATAPFDLTVEGVGAFPSAERPRVVWVGVSRGREELTRLAARVREALRDEGEPDRRDAFVPHLTLFRVRSPADHRRAVDLLQGAFPLPEPRHHRVAEFVLKESTLSAHGATHRTVATFPLRAPAPDPA
jgi:RNA 2',3'-cyclic 3'-phosphodiesterase